jgi:hypothetical protein
MIASIDRFEDQANPVGHPAGQSCSSLSAYRGRPVGRQVERYGIFAGVAPHED